MQVRRRLIRGRRAVAGALVQRADGLIEGDTPDRVVAAEERVEIRPAVGGGPRRAGRAALDAHDAAQRRTVPDRGASRPGHGQVVEPAVRHLVRGRQAGDVRGIVGATGLTRDRRRGARRGKRASFEGETDIGPRRCAATGEQLHDAGHGVGSEQRGVGAAHHLDPVEVLRGHVAQIERAARHEHRRDGAGRPGRDDDRAGRVAQQIGEQRFLLPRDVGGIEHRHRCRHLSGRRLGARGRDDDVFRDRRDLQRQSQRPGRGTVR